MQGCIIDIDTKHIYIYLWAACLPHKAPDEQAIGYSNNARKKFCSARIPYAYTVWVHLVRVPRVQLIVLVYITYT